MRRKLTSAPAIEPITVNEAKAFARVTIDNDDDLIEGFIIAARQYVEAYIQGALITQTWTFYFDADEEIFSKRFVNLPIRPIISITSVKTYTDANVAEIYSSDNYRLSDSRVLLNDAYEWPDNYRIADSAEFVVVAGFGPLASDVPEAIRLAIKMIVAQWYEKREASYDPTEGSQAGTVPFGVTALLQPYRNFFS